MTAREILLVEDDELNHALVRATLARSGDPLLRETGITAAGTLARARALLAERAFDLILLDMRLPDGTGLTLAGELLATSEPPPVIVMTGAAAEHGSAALAAGCAAVLAKPYSAAELRAAVTAQLAGDQPTPP